MKLRWTLALSAVSLFVVGCASLPKDAPPELKAAKAELDRADNLDSDETFPKTVSSAEENFDKSVDMFEESKEMQSGAEEARRQSIELANRSRALAFGANELKKNMTEWDQNLESLEGNYSIPTLIGRLREIQTELDNTKQQLAQAQQQPPQVESPFARMSDFRMQAPVAFFDTGKTELGDEFRSAIEDLARTVQPVDVLRVTVTGYADARGSDNRNDEIAMARAESVAQILRDSGVDPARITIESMGEKEASQDAGMDKMQLDRKVTVTVVNGATRPQ